jgi:ankyrin repeat protein
MTSPWSSHGQAVGSALHRAVENGHADVIDTLLSAGADVSLKDAKGRTAVEIARQKGMDAIALAKFS